MNKGPVVVSLENSETAVRRVKVQARDYDSKDEGPWEELTKSAPTGTIVHSRAFLSYHGNRFKDRSIVVFNDEQMVAALPVAEDPGNSETVVSHPGATYGGLLFIPKMRAQQVEEIFGACTELLKSKGYKKLIYKAVPAHIQSPLVQSDLYYLLRRQAKLTRRDLWNVIPLDVPRKLSKGRKWGIGKATKQGIIVESSNDYEKFHAMLTQNLQDRHDAKPVHSHDEMKKIKKLLPDQVELQVARTPGGEILAGTWVFKVKRSVWHTQYIASTQQGRDEFAVDLLIENVIEKAETQSVKMFSFGASTEDAGKNLNSGLFDFKASFGTGAAVQDFYELEL